MEERIKKLEKDLSDFKISQTEKDNERENRLSTKALDYSKKTINYFLLVLGIAGIVLAIFFGKTISDFETHGKKLLDAKAESVYEEINKGFIDEFQKRLDEIEEAQKGFESIYNSYRKAENLEHKARRTEDETKRNQTFQQSINILDSILKEYPKEDTAYYYKSFIYALLNNPQNALHNLRKTVEYDESGLWKDWALDDRDFEELRKDEEFEKEFLEIIQGN